MDTDTGIVISNDLRVKPDRMAVADWLVRELDEITFRMNNDKIEATFSTLKITDEGKLYDAKGLGDSANDAVRELAEDLKDERVIVKDSTYRVYEDLSILKLDWKEKQFNGK